MSFVGLVDSHLHLQSFSPETDTATLVRQAVEAGVTHLACNGTREKDWLAVKQYAEKLDSVVPSYGLHPWFVDERPNDWLAVLESYVQAQPCGVGEIGLDKLVDGADMAVQEEVFRAQLGLARKYDRPVMIHCVKAWGQLLDVLRSEPELPVGMLLHSYGGSVDLIKPLASMGAYFSFSGNVLSERFKHARQALLAVPVDRLLLETDAPFMLPPEEFRIRTVVSSDGVEQNHPANLPGILRGVAELLGEEPEKLRERLWENARKIFRL